MHTVKKINVVQLQNISTIAALDFQVVRLDLQFDTTHDH